MPVDPTLFKDPSLRKEYAPQINEIEAQRRQAESEAQRIQREQERATLAAEKEAERTQKEIAKQQLTAANVAAEAQYMNEKRPYHKTEDGRIAPKQDDATYAAEQAAKQARAAQEWQYKQAGRKYTKNPTDGSLIPESDEALAARQAAEADKIRQDAITQQMESIKAEAGVRPLALTDTDRKKREAELKRAQQDALYALTPKLQQVAKQTDKAGWWDMLNNNPTTPAQEAQARLTRLNQPDATLDEADLADLEADPTTQPYAAKIRSLKDQLGADDEARTANDQTRQTLADLNLRRTDPAKWQARQLEKISKLDAPSLQSHLATSNEQLKTRLADFDARKAELEQPALTFKAEEDNLIQQNEQAKQRGIPASELVTLTDGSTWHKPLYAKLAALDAQRTAWQADAEPKIKALSVDAQEIQRELQVHNASIAAANQRRENEQKQQLAKLSEIPALAGHAAFLQALQQESGVRRQALDRQYPDGPESSPEAKAAYDALQQDMDAKWAPIQQAMVQTDHDIARTVADAYDMVTQAKGRGTDRSQALQHLVDTLKVTPAKAESMLADAEKVDWSRGDEDDQSRVLSDGRLIIRPSLWTDEAAYTKAVVSSTAPQSEKDAALEQFPQRREEAAQAQLEALKTLTAFRTFAEKQPAGMTAVDIVEKFGKTHGWWRTQRDQLLMGLGQGVVGLFQAGVGAYEWMTRDKDAAALYEKLSTDAGRLGGVTQSLPSGQWTALAGNLVVGSLPSLAIGGYVGEALAWSGGAALEFAGLIPKAAAASKGIFTATQVTNLMKGLHITGIAGTAGVQTFGQVYGDAVMGYQRQGFDLKAAQDKATLPAVISGLSTFTLTAIGGLTGTEALARLQTDKLLKKDLKTFLKAVIGGGLREGALEELPDQIIQSIVEKYSYNPDKPMSEIIQEAMVAFFGGAAMGSAFEGLTELDNLSLSASAQQQLPSNTANLPETVAAAETAIDAYAPEGLDEASIARTQATARALLYIAQGDIDSLPDADLALVGVGRGKDGQLENIKTEDGQPPRVKIENGEPLITQTTLDRLEQEMPAVRAAIPLGEMERRQQINDANNPAPTPEATVKESLTVQPDTDPAPVNPASLSENQDPAATERQQQLSTYLQNLGMPADQADQVAGHLVAKRGVLGEDYLTHVVDPTFRKDLAALGITGSLQPSESRQNPLKAPADLAQRIQGQNPGQKKPQESVNSPASSAETPVKSGTPETPKADIPADTPGLDMESYMKARQAAIKKTPVAARKGALKLLGALDKALTRYAGVFDGIRFSNPDGKGLNLSGGGLELNRDGKGKAFLDVDLGRWLEQHSRLVDKAGVAATAEVEEEFIHRAAVNIFTDADMRGFWNSLPYDLRNKVYQGYHVADIANDAKKDGKTFPENLPEKITDLHAFQLGHEFLRMLVQDSAFKGRVSEAVATDPALGERIIAFLQRLVDELRRLIDKAPADTRITIREYEKRVTNEVNRLRKSLPDPLRAKETPETNLASAGDGRKSVLSAANPVPTVRTDFQPVTGSTGTAHTDSNDAIEYEWAVVDVNSLNISNQDDGRINPDYPQELQPRDRTSAGSEAQVADIAKNMNLDRLSASSGVGDGAPIIGPDGVVESGNGRVMGMRRAHGNDTSASRVYAANLAKNAAAFGLTKEQVEKVKNPVLVRVRKTEVDRVAFVLSANVSTIAPKREIEQAKIDSKQIVPDLFASFVPDESGQIFTPANADFIRSFISAIVPPAERPAIIDAKGNLTQTGLRRLRNALFVHAYGDSPESLNALGRLTESLDTSGNNIVTALVAAAPRFAEQNARESAGALYPLSITGDLAQVIQTLQDLRNKGEKVADFLAQDRIPGIGDDPTPLQKELLQFLDANASRPRQIIEALSRYAAAVDAAGDPKQTTLFGDEPRPTREELWNLASTPAHNAPLSKGTVAAPEGSVDKPFRPDLPPKTALKLYRKLKKLELENGRLLPSQSQALEQAERSLGQLFLFDNASLTRKPAEDLALESESFRSNSSSPEQLSLFSATKSITPAWLKPVDSLQINDTLGRYGISSAHSFRNPANALGRIQGEADSRAGDTPEARRTESRSQSGGRSTNAGIVSGLSALPRLNVRAFYEGLNGIPTADRHKGQEHTAVYDRTSGRAVKMTDPGQYGARGSLVSYLQQMEQQNTEFDDDIAIEGWVLLPGESAPRLITSQPWITGRESTLPEIDTYMRRKGYQRAYDGAWWNGTKLVTDALPKNFVTDHQGHVHPIDLVFATPTSNSQIERLDNLVSSQPQPDPTPEPPPLATGTRVFNSDLQLTSLLSTSQQQAKTNSPPENPVEKNQRTTPLATSQKSAYDAPDGNSNRSFLDPWTSGPSFIRGARVTREQGQAIGHAWRERLRSGLTEPETFDWTPGPALAERLSQAYPGIPTLSPAQFGRLSNLPILGEGMEGTVHADTQAGVVYKIMENTGSTGAGIWNQPGWTSRGRLDWQYQPASRPRHLGLRIALQNLMGGTPTEMVGFSPQGRIILKQPLSPDPSAGQTGNLYATRRDSGIVDLPAGMLMEDGYKASIVVVEGRPWLVTDLLPDNYVGDNQGAARINDPIFGQLTPAIISKIPGLANVVREAARQASELGDRSLRLFSGTKSLDRQQLSLPDAISQIESMASDLTDPDYWPEDLQNEAESRLEHLDDDATAPHPWYPEKRLAQAQRYVEVTARLDQLDNQPEDLTDPESVEYDALTDEQTTLDNQLSAWAASKKGKVEVLAPLQDAAESRMKDTIRQIEATGRYRWNTKDQTFEETDPEDTTVLFKSTVAPESSDSPSPLAKLGWNHLDRALTAKIAAHSRWINEKTGAGEVAARWLGDQRLKPFQAFAKVLKRELFPDSILPREVTARKREMEIKTALGAQRSMDLVRALSGTPKFSDMAYPPEFSQNPTHRRNLYLAMTGEVPMSSLPPAMQALAKKLREHLVSIGREAVKQGRMSAETFHALEEGYMPHYYKEDVQREKSLFHRFRLGIRDILAQRTTAWHIVDHQNKDADGQPRLLSHTRNQWRFRNKEHRDAFFEDFLLQQSLEEITNRNGKQNRNLTLADLRAPAKLPPETRGRLKEINRQLRLRYTKERPLTVAEQEKAGLIMDPVYAIARYTAQMVHDNSTAEFFNFVAANPQWVSNIATPNFTEIPDNPRFGRLAGKYVTDDVARQLLEMVEAPNTALQMYDTLLGWWKTGKALALDTPIPTPSGWTTMGALQAGDTIFDDQGQPCQVEFATEVMRDHTCYRVEFSDGTAIIADAEHLWATHRGGDSTRQKISTTEEIRATLHYGTKNWHTHSIPNTQELNTPEADLPVSPYVLGAWLGDGTSRSASITIGGDDLAAMTALLTAEGMNCERTRKDNRNQVHTVQLKTAAAKRKDTLQSTLRRMGVLGSGLKHIPGAYLRAGPQQRLSLLQGLMDTDGSISPKGLIEFSTSLPSLRDGFLELCRSLGFKPTCTTKKTTAKNSFRIRFHADRPVFRLPRKLARMKTSLTSRSRSRSQSRQITAVVPVDSVPVRCIQVSSPSKLYLAGHAMVPTHNTVLNPGTHVRNVLGNIFFSQLAGTSVWNPGNIRYYKDSLSALRNGGRDLQEAYEMGVLGADFVSAELRQTLRQLLPDPATITESDESAGRLMGIGKAIGKAIGNYIQTPTHKAYNQIAALYQAEDEVFKLAAYLKARAMARAGSAGTPALSEADARAYARDHVRQYFPYFDSGTSGTLKALGRTAMPFLGFYRESIRIFGNGLKDRPLSLAAGLAVPSLITFLSAMLLGLDDDELDQVQKDMRGKAGKLLGPTPLEGLPLFAMLLPFRSDTGALQQFDISAVHPFVDFLGNRVESGSGEDWWQKTIRSIVAAGPIGSLLYSQMTGRDAFGDRTFVESNMTGLEKIAARTDNAVKTLLPPLFPGGTGFQTLLNAGTRTTGKTLEVRSPTQAVLRAVGGLDVRNATPDLYRIAEDWRKANKIPTTEGMDFGSTTPTSRARKALFAALAQDEPNLKAIHNILKKLEEFGTPVRTPQDIQKLLFYKNPLMIIRGQENQARFRASLSGLERQVLEDAMAEYQKIKARAPALIRQAQSQ